MNPKHVESDSVDRRPAPPAYEAPVIRDVGDGESPLAAAPQVATSERG